MKVFFDDGDLVDTVFDGMSSSEIVKIVYAIKNDRESLEMNDLIKYTHGYGKLLVDNFDNETTADEDFFCKVHIYEISSAYHKIKLLEEIIQKIRLKYNEETGRDILENTQETRH